MMIEKRRPVLMMRRTEIRVSRPNAIQMVTRRTRTPRSGVWRLKEEKRFMGYQDRMFGQVRSLNESPGAAAVSSGTSLVMDIVVMVGFF